MGEDNVEVAPPLVHDAAREVGTVGPFASSSNGAAYRPPRMADLEADSPLDRLNSRVSRASEQEIDNLMRQLTRRSTRKKTEAGDSDTDADSNEFDDLLGQIFDVRNSCE